MSTNKDISTDEDEEYYYTSDSDSDRSSNSSANMHVMDDEELVQLYRDQFMNTQELLLCSEEDDDDEAFSQDMDVMELVQLYKDQALPIETLLPPCVMLQAQCSSRLLVKDIKSLFWNARLSKRAFFIYTIIVAIALAYLEQLCWNNSFKLLEVCDNLKTNSTLAVYKMTGIRVRMLFIAIVITSGSITISNYLYRLKIEALVHDILEQLQARFEYHAKYPQIYPSAAVSVSHIRSTIIRAADIATIKDWQCVTERINAHPLIKRSFKEERGDFIEYWELVV